MSMRRLPIWDHRIEPADPRSGRFQDSLDRRQLAEILASRLLRDRPAVVGLYGSWGAGKSFVLDLTIDALFGAQGEVRPLVCSFQPWRYEPDTSLAPGLVHAIETLPAQFPHLNPEYRDDARTKLIELGKNLRGHIRSAVGRISGMAGPVLASQGIAGVAAAAGLHLVGQSPESPDVDMREQTPEEIRKQMSALIGELCESAAKVEGRSASDYRVVVVIDDLDRCGPDLLVDTLNWLKIHLTVPGCSYLLALDHGAAARAIVGRYRDYLGAYPEIAYGYRYLEKIVDYEVELSASPLVEAMAVKTVAGAGSVQELVERCLGRQGVRSAEIKGLIALPTLQSPRTMLKVVHRFGVALEYVSIREQQKTDKQHHGEEQLPGDYPFWLLLFSAMYYRLSPTDIELFCVDRGPLASRDNPTLASGLQVEQDNQAIREFWQFLWSLAPNGEAPQQMLPSREARRQLYAAVRRG
ncbi:MAG: hypothetical protein HKP61_21125 [Dactylosporangium sp.]|nr:KAP family NTPase [Dactylosporangium sp.]NNJ63384.1 hypothetical protein [Dactylosporangium sp.]